MLAGAAAALLPAAGGASSSLAASASLPEPSPCATPRARCCRWYKPLPHRPLCHHTGKPTFGPVPHEGSKALPLSVGSHCGPLTKIGHYTHTCSEQQPTWKGGRDGCAGLCWGGRRLPCELEGFRRLLCRATLGLAPESSPPDSVALSEASRLSSTPCTINEQLMLNPQGLPAREHEQQSPSHAHTATHAASGDIKACSIRLLILPESTTWAASDAAPLTRRTRCAACLKLSWGSPCTRQPG